ncbi:XrtA/PEP-CTERM system exopolysaccharide export protein [Acidihalobacter ferrooxydans]|uniref:Uncharacterized protein n=1 Tax=Acidihalobacter ferrooxydans TaxID=1765967 RepID=A0A1P8UI40_9GAMM|nr:XrtA/PEP-CTERM system exopolysaccharide export protein [Acidihalobacter ferrooxydans]APZ43496.1 hypothetical protein BW247_10680 [Acidihalobacter ferrooxydans]
MRKITKIVHLLLGALLVGTLAACSSGLPPLSSAPVAETTPVYRIAAGDQLQIYVAGHSDLSTTVPVGPDGRISIPLVQGIDAEGKTPSQLAKDIEKSLSHYVRNPDVTVIVRSFNSSFSNEVRVIGQAVKPQAIPYSKGMTLLDALTAVGGLTPYAAGNRAELIRRIDGKEKVYQVYLGSLLNGDMKDNAPLRPGDVIVIPQKLF